MSYIVTFAGKTNEDMGMMVYKRPDIRTSEENISTYEIPGREMDLVDRTGRYKPVKIDITFNYVSKSDEWGKAHRNAVLWLRQTGNLILSDDPDVFRKVLYVQIGDNERSVKRIGKFTAVFVCRPGVYLADRSDFVIAEDIAESVSGKTYTLQNGYSDSRPVYRLTGYGECTLTVNGNSMIAVVDGMLVIDTDLKIAYTSEDIITNTAISGDYDDMVLVHGENTIAIDGNAELEIQANYRVI